MSTLRTKPSSTTLQLASSQSPSCARDCKVQIEAATNALHLSNIVSTIHCELLAARPRIDFITPHHVVMLYHGDAVAAATNYSKNLKSLIVLKMRSYIKETVSHTAAAARTDGPILPLAAESWYLSRLLAAERAWSPLDWELAAPTQRLLLTRNLERFVNEFEEYLSITDVLIGRLEKCWPLLDRHADVRETFKKWQETGYKMMYRPSAHWLRSPWFATRDEAIKEILEIYHMVGKQLSKQKMPYHADTADTDKSIYRLLSVKKA